ncbi:MAG: radical SAM protein [Candidatus Lokiarchaeota archaeon]|nr:radical SAM protein [Candidatus Lokiarchaeota archaeon]
MIGFVIIDSLYQNHTLSHYGWFQVVDVLLVNPYFNEELDKSIFRYPPLGIGYLASVLRINGFEVDIIDCTFSRMDQVLNNIREIQPKIVGIYSMVTINHHALDIANQIRNEVELLVVGGPLPTLVPEHFLDIFDVVVLNEGEETFLELVRRFLNGVPWNETKGIAFKHDNGQILKTKKRPFEKNLDTIPFPARDLFPNHAYQKYWKVLHGYTSTSMMTTRGCPYNCDFCSNPVFGRSYRERSAQNVYEEMVEIKQLGYDRVFFQDDCFTLSPNRTHELCDMLIENPIGLNWMCLSRADTLTQDLAEKMYQAGCKRIFFGIESGDPRILRIMNKQIIPEDAKIAIQNASRTGMETGAFFILGYPGETNDSLLRTVNFSSKLPVDYLSYSFPYPIYGTGLYKKVRNKITNPEWRKQRGKSGRHQLLFQSDFSEIKLRLAKHKGVIQHQLLRMYSHLGFACEIVFENISDRILSIMR